MKRTRPAIYSAEPRDLFMLVFFYLDALTSFSANDCHGRQQKVRVISFSKMANSFISRANWAEPKVYLEPSHMALSFQSIK